MLSLLLSGFDYCSAVVRFDSVADGQHTLYLHEQASSINLVLINIQGQI